LHHTFIEHVKLNQTYHKKLLLATWFIESLKQQLQEWSVQFNTGILVTKREGEKEHTAEEPILRKGIHHPRRLHDRKTLTERSGPSSNGVTGTHIYSSR
jgi:hypothetical protein